MWELSFDQIRHGSVGSRLPLSKRSVGSGELDEGDRKGQELGLADAGEDVEANRYAIHGWHDKNIIQGLQTH
jgi:hypothetical protein